jgi:transposase
MDANGSYPLVPLVPEQRSLIPARPDPIVRFRRRFFYNLAWLLFLALVLLRWLRRQVIELRLQANYWRALHQRAVQREDRLKKQIQQLQGELRELKRRCYGKKSETSSSIHSPSNPNNNNGNGKKRSRGQQPGSKGHGRRDHDHLPTTHEPCTLPQDQQSCARCGQPFVELPGTADGDILEIEVRAHRRRYHRQRYRCH